MYAQRREAPRNTARANRSNRDRPCPSTRSAKLCQIFGLTIEMMPAIASFIGEGVLEVLVLERAPRATASRRPRPRSLRLALTFVLERVLLERYFDNALAETPSFLAMLACERLELRSVVRSADSRIFCWLPLFRRATFVAPAAAMVLTQGTLGSTSVTMATNLLAKRCSDDH